VLDATKEYDFPILASVDFGHQIANIPLPIGVEARMDASDRTLAIMGSGVQ